MRRAMIIETVVPVRGRQGKSARWEADPIVANVALILIPQIRRIEIVIVTLR
jgi:hypothetical protein